MRFKVILAVVAAALVAGVTATTAKASPDPALKITPTSQLQFGTVPIGTMVIKPVVILNRTTEWVYYSGTVNGWPNYDYPGIGVQPFPKGFWEVDPANPYGNTTPFTCWDIAPKSSCTLYFGWLPYETGTHTAEFGITYTGYDSGTLYPSEVITMIGTGY